MRYVKFFIETMNFCQGNCQGCFFSKEERASGTFISSYNLDIIIKNIKEYLLLIKEDIDLTIVFGQGDHLSLNNNQLDYFLEKIKLLKPFNPLIIFTTSAIKNKTLKDKVEKIRNFSSINNMNILPAVILDIKKLIHKNFSDIYLNNLSYIRESFGLLDLVINIGQDTIKNFEPKKLKNFLLSNKFRHIEFNLIPTKNTIQQFNSENVWEEILKWVKNVNLELYKHMYVFHIYNYNMMKKERVEASLGNLIEKLKNTMINHIYIDSSLKVIPALSGFLGNAVPYSNKITNNLYCLPIFDLIYYDKHIENISKKILKRYLGDKNCISCQYINKCIDSGVDVYRDLNLNYFNDNCFIGAIKIFEQLEKIEHDFYGVNKIINSNDIIAEDYFGKDVQGKVYFNE